MAAAYVKEIGYANNKSAGTTLSATTFGTAVAAGNLIVAVAVFDNASTASKPVVSSFSKPASETASWVFLGAARSTGTTAGNFSSGEIWCIKTTVSWPTSTSITMTLDTSVTMKAIQFAEFSGVNATPRSTAGTAYSTTTTVASATTTGTTPQVGDLAVGLVFGSNVASAAGMNDTDTTGGSWVVTDTQGVGTTGGNVATNNTGRAQAKVLNAASHQTLNASGTMTASNGAIVAILQQTQPPAFTQATYGIYLEGKESDSVLAAAQDTAPSLDCLANRNVQLRVRLQNTTANAGAATDDYQLQYEKNASGTWVNVTAATTNVAGMNSPGLTDAAATTNRLGAGTGSFVAGKLSEDGLVDDVAVTPSNYTELMYSIVLKSADLANSDTLRFRVLFNGAITGMTYTATPTINVTKSAGPLPSQGQTVWLDASDASTFTYGAEGGGTAVDQWRNKAQAKHFDWGAGGAASEKSTRNTTVNGLAAVSVSPPGHVRYAGPGPIQTNVDNWAIFVVCNLTGTPGTDGAVPFFNGAPGGDGYGPAVRATGNNGVGGLYGGVAWFDSNIPNPAWPHVEMVGRVGGVTQHYVNGVASSRNGTTQGVPNTPTAATYLPDFVGTHGFTGDVCEVRMFDRALSLAEITLFNDSLYAKWVPLISVTATRATTWTARSIVTATKATTWDTEVRVTATRATTWSVLRTLAAPAMRATTWNVLPLGAAPGPPIALQATPVAGGTSMDLDWEAPASDGGSAITDYIVEYRLVEAGSALSPFLMSANYGPQMQNTSFTIDKPPNLQVGDTLLFISGTEDQGIEPLWTFPTSGWVKATGFPIHDTFSPHMWIQCYWKIADASDVALSQFTCTLSVNGYSYPYLSRISDHNGLSPVILTSWKRETANTPKLVGGTTTDSGLLLIGYGTSWESGPMQGSSDAYWTALLGTPGQGNVGFFQQQRAVGTFPDKDFADTALDFAGASVVMALRGNSAYTDDFNRADGGLGSNWSAPAWGVLANGAGKTTGSNDFGVFLRDTGSTDMWAECTVLRDDNFMCLDVRMQGSGDGGGGGTSYLGFWDPANWWALGKNLGGSWGGQFATGSTTTVPRTLPYRMRLEAEGSTVRLYINDVLAVSATDTSITTGKYAGANCGFNVGAPAMDDYRCGPLPYVPGPPYVVASASSAQGPGVDSVAVPAGGKTGDYYLVWFQIGDMGTSPPTPAISGFTLEPGGMGGMTDQHACYFWKAYSGSEGSTFTATGFDTGKWTGLVAYLVRGLPASWTPPDPWHGGTLDVNPLVIPAVAVPANTLMLNTYKDWHGNYPGARPATWRELVHNGSHTGYCEAALTARTMGSYSITPSGGTRSITSQILLESG